MGRLLERGSFDSVVELAAQSWISKMGWGDGIPGRKTARAKPRNWNLGSLEKLAKA